jgi:hypothetical protein
VSPRGGSGRPREHRGPPPSAGPLQPGGLTVERTERLNAVVVVLSFACSRRWPVALLNAARDASARRLPPVPPRHRGAAPVPQLEARGVAAGWPYVVMSRLRTGETMTAASTNGVAHRILKADRSLGRPPKATGGRAGDGKERRTGPLVPFEVDAGARGFAPRYFCADAGTGVSRYADPKAAFAWRTRPPCRRIGCERRLR